MSSFWSNTAPPFVSSADSDSNLPRLAKLHYMSIPRMHASVLQYLAEA